MPNKNMLFIACDCYATGSVVAESCNAVTGQCHCKENFTGRTCDRCVVYICIFFF